MATPTEKLAETGKVNARQVDLRIPLEDAQIGALLRPHGKFEITQNGNALQIDYVTNTYGNFSAIEKLASCQKEGNSWYLYIDVKEALSPREENLDAEPKIALVNALLVRFGFAEQALKFAQEKIVTSQIQLYFARTSQATDEGRNAALAEARAEYDRSSLIYDLLKPLEGLNSIIRIG